MFGSWLTSRLMRKSIDDKVEKALRMHEQTDIADSRVASRLKRVTKTTAVNILVFIMVVSVCEGNSA